MSASRLILKSNLVAITCLPILAWQAWRLNDRVLRLHEAPDLSGHVAGPGPAFRLLLIGESTSAGVGADTNHDALAGHLARRLSVQMQRAIHWRVIGMNGYTARDNRKLLCPQVASESADMVVIVHGFNDTVGWTSPARWKNELGQILDYLNQRLNQPRFVLSGIPPFRAFPQLPEPVRSVLGLRADALELASIEFSACRNNLDFVRLSELPASDFYCADGFHPSSKGYALWAEAIADQIR